MSTTATSTPSTTEHAPSVADTDGPLARLDMLQPYALAAARILLGYLLVAHGLDKFDNGLDNVGAQFAEWGVPAADLSATGVALLEVIAGAALIIGIGARVAAGLAALMLVGALYFVKFDLGVLGGSETDFAYIAGLLAIFAVGAGRFSLDAALGLDRR